MAVSFYYFIPLHAPQKRQEKKKRMAKIYG